MVFELWHYGIMGHYNQIRNGQVNINALLTILKSNNMVWNCAVAFSLLFFIGNTMGEGALSNIYRFRIFPEDFLDSTSQTFDASSLLGK